MCVCEAEKLYRLVQTGIVSPCAVWCCKAVTMESTPKGNQTEIINLISYNDVFNCFPLNTGTEVSDACEHLRTNQPLRWCSGRVFTSWSLAIMSPDTTWYLRRRQRVTVVWGSRSCTRGLHLHSWSGSSLCPARWLTAARGCDLELVHLKNVKISIWGGDGPVGVHKTSLLMSWS